MLKIGMNEPLHRVFQIRDLDLIIQIIIREFNRVIEEIAPSKVIQCSNRYQPWHDDEGLELMRYVNEQLSKCIE